MKMLVSKLLVIWATAAGAAAAAGSKNMATPSQRFRVFRAKTRHQSPLVLDDATFSALTSAPRNHTAVVLFTAMEPMYQCVTCQDFAKTWADLGRMWAAGDKDGESRTFLATLDVRDGRNSFVAYKMQTAPVILMFHPTIGPHGVASTEPSRQDFQNGALPANEAYAWIAKNLRGAKAPPFQRMIDWFLVLTSLAGLASAAIATVALWGFIHPFLMSRRVWVAGSLIMILVFTSGTMFNHIRRVPYILSDNKGGYGYIARGFMSQLGLETQIVAAVYGSLAFITIGLVCKAPKIADPDMQKLAVFVYSGTGIIMYSLLLRLFRMKNESYPFYFPPFI